MRIGNPLRSEEAAFRVLLVVLAVFLAALAITLLVRAVADPGAEAQHPDPPRVAG